MPYPKSTLRSSLGRSSLRSSLALPFILRPEGAACLRLEFSLPVWLPQGKRARVTSIFIQESEILEWN